MSRWIKGAVLSTIIAVSMVVFTLPTRAASPAQARAGLIAFVSNRSGQNEIYTMKADGADVKALTHGADGVSSIAPAWSPDGNHLTYFQRTAKKASLIVTDANGVQSITLVMVQTPDALLNTYLYLDWAPDSRRLLYAIGRAATNATGIDHIEFYVVDRDGSGTQLLNPVGVSNLALVKFLKDGSLIATTVQNENKVYHLDSAGSHPATVPLKSFYLIFMLPGGNQFASATYQSNSVDVFNLDKNTSKTLVSIPGIGIIWDMKWSPDARRLWVQGDEEPNLAATQDSSKRVPRVTFIVSQDGLTVNEFMKDLDGYGNRLSWSPDSQYLAYDAKDGSDYQIFLSRPDGTDKVKLTSDGANFQPAWQPALKVPG